MVERIPEGFTIREGTPDDLPLYTGFLQQTYENAYVDDSLGLTKEQFSPEVFATDDSQKYLLSNLERRDDQRTWVVAKHQELIGSVTVKNLSEAESELRGFYVAPEYQQRGIGSQLWRRVLNFAGERDIVLDLYTHNRNAIEMYKRWGFEQDTTKGENGIFYRHWPEWPEGLRAETMYMRRKGSRRD